MKWFTIGIGHYGEAKRLPEGGGCYAIYLDGQLGYIGQSMDLKKRILNHKINYARYSNAIETPWGRYSSVVMKVKMPRKFGEWAMIELRLINRLKPQFNQTGKKERKRAECIA